MRIDAIPSQFPGGGLLGDLLCSVTNLLNPGGGLGPLTTALNNLTAALNSLWPDGHDLRYPLAVSGSPV